MYKNFYNLQCISCKAQFDETQTVTRCLKCGDSLDVLYNYDFIRRRLNYYALKNSPISCLKYLDFYPILDLSKIVSLKEGGTPLYEAKQLSERLKIRHLYIKNEGANPTGVFKDRGTLVEITKALELKASAICLASSGNMAASSAAYAGLAGIPCYVLVPDGTPIGKLSQSLTYGARVLQIRDVYSTCAKLAEEMARTHNFYLAGDYVFRREGQKSQAYEIIEQLFWRAPDYVICPIGCGTNLSAIWKGFKEFYEFGFISKLPRLIGVQPEGASTVIDAFNKKKPIRPLERVSTLCSAVAVSNPLDGKLVLSALKESKGLAVKVSDFSALEAEQILGKEESIFVEPSGALGLSALLKLNSQHYFKLDDSIVVIATGVGLKDPITALKNLPDPPVLEPEMGEINRYITLKLYNIRAIKVREKAQKVWTKTPNVKELAKIIKNELNVDLQGSYLKKVHEQVLAFTEKSPTLKRADLQYIVENALKEYALQKEILSIVDYTLHITKHKRPKADVILKFNNQVLKADAEGVGPVDAIICAIKKAVKNKDTIGCQLLDYNVEIDTPGTDAVVEVRIRMKDKYDNQVTGVSVSPDVIVASIDAFTRGYNALYQKGAY